MLLKYFLEVDWWQGRSLGCYSASPQCSRSDKTPAEDVAVQQQEEKESTGKRPGSLGRPRLVGNCTSPALLHP